MNPLLDAVSVYAALVEAEETMCRALHPGREYFTDEEYNEVAKIIITAYEGSINLSQRAGIARVNLTWKDLVKKYKEATQKS